jgi:two-component system sensor histidine kinase KdpD
MRQRLFAVLASIAAVATVTAVIFGLRHFVPVLGLGVLYVFAVLPIAVVWGTAYAVPVAIASMLAFNFFFLEPVHTLTLADSRNWLALGVFVVTAIVVSELAARSRRRAQEAALLAEVATSLLEHGAVEAELARISAEVDELTRRDPSVRKRLLPALDSLLAVAKERERLAREAVEAEALRRADVIKTAVLRAVSHDLRTPLMAISTAAGALARTDLSIDNEDRAELLSTILAASDRLEHLVANLLDLSRLQAGAARPEPALLAVDELVTGALDELGEAGGRVELALPDESPPVRADAHQIQRVIVNVLENALKYSPAEEPVLVQVVPTSADVLVRVVDRGPGVAAEERERIFEPFQRGARGREPGAGLGLAIARGFAEANGGRLWVESHGGQGTAFVLALPAVRAAVTV